MRSIWEDVGAEGERTFPVNDSRHSARLPREVAEVVYEEYARLHGRDQSIERIAERGGFGWLEIAAFLWAAYKRGSA